jgi:hypothetical protein
VRTVAQPDIDAVLGNNYCIEIIETWLAEHSQDEALTDFDKILGVNSLQFLLIDITFYPPLFSLVNTFKVKRWIRTQLGNAELIRDQQYWSKL